MLLYDPDTGGQEQDVLESCFLNPELVNRMTMMMDKVCNLEALAPDLRWNPSNGLIAIKHDHRNDLSLIELHSFFENRKGKRSSSGQVYFVNKKNGTVYVPFNHMPGVSETDENDVIDYVYFAQIKGIPLTYADGTIQTWTKLNKDEEKADDDDANNETFQICLRCRHFPNFVVHNNYPFTLQCDYRYMPAHYIQ